jgi:hypothetical protein
MCKECQKTMTWAQQRVQWGRLKSKGYTEQEIKDAMPRCQKCLTRWVKLNPISGPLSVDRAREIARQACRLDKWIPPCTQLGLREKPPNLYEPPHEDCWWFYAPWGDGQDGMKLRSTRVVGVSKRTGAVLYNGSANDEG